MEFSARKKLIEFIEEFHVDIPLFWNNPKCAVRFDLTEISDAAAGEVVESVLLLLFENSPFLVCNYGSNSGREFIDKNLFLSNPEIVVIPYHLPSDDWHEYDHDCIACVCTSLNSFSVSNYISYVFEDDFISNAIFLIDTSRRIAVNVYDRRGMDVATDDTEIRKMLLEKYVQIASSS